ncbi:MAG: hypothetical protein ABW056_03615 [Thermoanaerobaculia bacterium]
MAALAGFLACAALSAGLMPSVCCSESCEPCPVVFCKSTPAASSQKVDTAHALPPASNHPFLLLAAAPPAATVAQIPAFLSHEFRRPMRN